MHKGLVQHMLYVVQCHPKTSPVFVFGQTSRYAQFDELYNNPGTEM